MAYTMDQEDIQELFERKYQKALGETYQDWLQHGPQSENQAYQRCIEIDKILNDTYDEWFNAEGERRDELQDYRDKLKAEYDFIEEVFALEQADRHF